MDCKDLMLGDFVYVARGYDKHLTIEEVKGIIADKDEPYPVTISTGETVSLNDIKPIPLTEDILVKNGFGKVNNQYFFGQVEIKELRDCWVVIINKENADIDINIHYVHQLQHLLRLCGIEKELVID